LKREFFPVAVVSCLLVAGLSHARRTTKEQIKPEQAATQPAPTPPPTLEEMPASPPQVTFRDGQLTIAATNSTLADILKAVRTQTGAAVDVPGNPTERVVGQFGPGPARDVLAALLNGSHFNYVLLGSDTNPNALDHVILMAKSGSVSEPPPSALEEANAGYAPGRLAPPLAPMSAPGTSATVQVQGESADATDADSDDTQDADSDDSTDDADADQTDQTQDQQGVAEVQDNGQQPVKTPEQMLQELQQQQNQQQQGIPPGAMPPGGVMPPGINPRQFPPGSQLPH
jgi:hypothetical protein